MASFFPGPSADAKEAILGPKVSIAIRPEIVAPLVTRL